MAVIPATTFYQPQTMSSIQTFVLPDNLYRTDEIIYFLSRLQGRPLPGRTFRSWCNYFGIVRDDYGYFWKEDLDMLRAWVRYKAKYGRRRTRQDFVEEYRKYRVKNT